MQNSFLEINALVIIRYNKLPDSHETMVGHEADGKEEFVIKILQILEFLKY